MKSVFALSHSKVEPDFTHTNTHTDTHRQTHTKIQAHTKINSVYIIIYFLRRVYVSL